MIKIATKEDCGQLHSLPPQVCSVVEEIVAKLNFYYGEHRNPDTDLGGYVLVIENHTDFDDLQHVLHQPISDVVPEFVDLIKAEKETFINALVICSDDFAISLIMPLALAPEPFLVRMEKGDGS